MRTMVTVGNLADGTTAGDLKRLFAPFGEVISADVLTFCSSGRSRGVGYVVMRAGAAAAAGSLDGAVHQGRRLTVAEVRPRTDDGGPNPRVRGGFF